MNHTRLWVVASIIGLIVIIMFFLSVPQSRTASKTELSQNVVLETQVLSLNDSYKNGLHTLSGSIEVPNSCTSVTAAASPVGSASSTDGIHLEISFPTDTGVCLQVPTLAKFSTTVTAPAQLPITATVNGNIASTTAS